MTMTTHSRLGPLPNFFLYQLTWFACVMGAAGGQPWIGVGVALLVIGLHLGLAHAAATELKIILLTGLIGALWETLLVSQGWVRYSGGSWTGFAPWWIIALWLTFATTFNVSLRWLQGRHGLSALLGLIGGPLAWYAGMRMGALELLDPAHDLLAIGLGWAVLMPSLLRLAARLTGPPCSITAET
jgi:hypothetical protein